MSFGRDDHCGLHAADARMSGVLAIFSPSDRGWIVTNGRRTRMSAESPFIVAASFAPRAQVLLQAAAWTLRWDLDVLVEMTVSYRRDVPKLPTVRDRPKPERSDHLPAAVGTAIAGEQLSLTDLQRRRMAALFAYLINESPKPGNLAAAASVLTGDESPRLMKVAARIRDQINTHRDEPIETLEALGYHLVHVAGIIGPDDLEGI